MKITVLNAWAKNAQQRKGKVRAFQTALQISILTGFLAIFSSQLLHAQSPPITWVDKGTFQIGYQLSSNASTFQANEQVSVKLYTDVQSPVTAIGADFDLFVSSLVSIAPSSAYTIPPSSELGTASELSTSFQWNATSSQADATIWRSDSVQRSFSGHLMTVNFVVGSTAVKSEDLVRSLDGGLVIMDNLDMRLANPAIEEPLVQTKVYPNPCTNWISVQHAGRESLHLRMWNLRGNTVLEADVVPGERKSLHGVGKGIYLVEVLGEGGERLYHGKIFKR